MLYFEMSYGISHNRQHAVIIEMYLAGDPHTSQCPPGTLEWENRALIKTYLAMFLWTKISPGLDPVTTDSGTLESEQPIHSTYQKPRSRKKERECRQHRQRQVKNRKRTSGVISKKERERWRPTWGDCPLDAASKKPGCASPTAWAHLTLRWKSWAKVGSVEAILGRLRLE